MAALVCGCVFDTTGYSDILYLKATLASQFIMASILDVQTRKSSALLIAVFSPKTLPILMCT